MPTFSVVIPAHNRQQLIVETLQSVFSQTYTDFEILCVDDGSIDQTKKVLESFEPRIRVLAQANGGPGSARNLAIRHATGRYIAFLDSDDLWLPWTLATYQKVIDQYSPAVIAGSFSCFFPGKPLPTIACTDLTVEWFKDYFHTSAHSHHVLVSAMAVEASTLRLAGGFTEKPIYAEDWDLLIQLGTAPGFAKVSSPIVARYRQHDGSAVFDLDRTYAGMCNLISAEKLGKYPGGQQRSADRKRIATRHIRPLSLKLLKKRQLSNAWSLYWNTLLWHIADQRWRYLVAFPVLFAFAFVGRLASSRDPSS